MIQFKCTSKVEALIKNEELAEKLNAGETGVVVVSKTPFYAEMGGQIGDTGVITGKHGEAKVVDCKKNISGKTIQFVEVTNGYIEKDEEVTLKVDVERRNNIAKNHTATHMLQAALKEVLGDHVHQSGSYVDDEKLRFDFTHFAGVTTEELIKVERIVNERIMKIYDVNTDVMTLDEAKKTGATALFDDKYGDKCKSCFCW